MSDRLILSILIAFSIRSRPQLQLSIPTARPCASLISRQWSMVIVSPVPSVISDLNYCLSLADRLNRKELTSRVLQPSSRELVIGKKHTRNGCELSPIQTPRQQALAAKIVKILAFFCLSFCSGDANVLPNLGHFFRSCAYMPLAQAHG